MCVCVCVGERICPVVLTSKQINYENAKNDSENYTVIMKRKHSRSLSGVCRDTFGWRPTSHPNERKSVLDSGSAPSWVTGRLEQLPVYGQGGVQKCILPSAVFLSSVQSPLLPLMMLCLQTPAVGVGQSGCVPLGHGGTCDVGDPQLTVCRFTAVYNKTNSSSHCWCWNCF